MSQSVISNTTLKFLKELSIENNREWFNANKERYLSAHANMSAFVDVLIREMNKHDVLENESGKKSLYRIYNDVRFSKDKTPYNARFAFSLKRATKQRRGGYYVNIKPGNSFLACGFFAPNSEDLKRIREDIDVNYEDWNKIIRSKIVSGNFSGLTGEKVKTAPKGYSIDHPAIELLRHKRFIFRHDFKDKEVVSPDFVKQVNQLLKSIRPYFDYMSEVLTTNANGESLLN